MRARVHIVAGRGASSRCCREFVEYAIMNNAAAGKEDVVQAFQLSIPAREDDIRAF